MPNLSVTHKKTIRRRLHGSVRPVWWMPLVGVCVFAMLNPPADAQTVNGTAQTPLTPYGPPPANWRPIDQAHEDLDPLAAGGRVVQKGLRSNGEQTSLFEVTTPNLTGRSHLPPDTTLYRLGPGFRARVIRMDYLVRGDVLKGDNGIELNHMPFRDGEFVELLGAGVVYELSPTPQLPGPRLYRPSPYLVDGRTTRGAMQSNVFLAGASGGDPNVVAGFDGRLKSRSGVSLGGSLIVPDAGTDPPLDLMRHASPALGGDTRAGDARLDARVEGAID